MLMGPRRIDWCGAVGELHILWCMTPRSAATAARVTKKKAVVKTAVKAGGRAGKTQAGKVPVTRAGGAAKVETVSAHPHPPVAYRLHALLHTIHSIDHHEDHLCTLLTAIEREGAVSPALRRELAALLEELPMQAFVADLEAARQALSSGTARGTKQKRA